MRRLLFLIGLLLEALLCASAAPEHLAAQVGAGAAASIAASATPSEQPAIRQRVLQPFADPNAAFLLLTVGIFGIMLEFLLPGLVFPGVTGGVAVLIAFASLARHPVRPAGVAALVLALVLFAVVARGSRPVGFGIAAAISMALGAVMLIDKAVGVGIGWWTAIGVTIPFASLATILLAIAGRAKRNKQAAGIASDGVGQKQVGPHAAGGEA
ncbi:MAG: hypothetical protein ABI823_21525 [Bryobacteraceae bacterium]